MPLSDPVRLHIMKQLCEAIREIEPANGYESDFSGDEGTTDNRVFRGRAIFGEGDPIPMISVLENPIPLEQLEPPQDSVQQTGPWELVIQGFVKDDKTNPTDPAHVAMADVKKRLAIEKSRADWDKPEQGILGLGRVITGLRVGAGVVRPPDEYVSAKAFFWLLITLDLAEDLSDPYEGS